MLLKAILFLSLAIFAECQLEWRQVMVNSSSPMPQGRRDHAIGYDAVRNRMILFGGRDGGAVFQDTWFYDFDTSQWTRINPPTSPEARFSMVYGVSNGFFYISTGQEGQNLYDDVWRFDLSANTWQKMNAQGRKPAQLYGAVGGFYSNTSDELYFSHGFSFDLRYSHTLIYRVSTNTWEERVRDKNAYHFNHPSPRCIHSGTMVAPDQLVMYGGCLSGGQTGGACPGLDSWLYSDSKQEWTHLEECASPRTYSSLALLPVRNGQRRAVLYGGAEDNDQVLIVDKADPDQVAILNVNKEEWSLRKASGGPPAKRVGASMIPHPMGLLMFGGNSFNDIWYLIGDSDAADATPEHSQECKKPFAGTLNLIMLHGVFMIIGWGILLQFGAFIARYLRSKDPLWFHLHRICQVTGLLFALAGLICGIESVRFDHFKFAHGALGLFVMILGLQQPFNALIRPHKEKGEEPSLFRKIWEIFHLNSGRLALILSVVTIVLGMFLAQAHNGHFIAFFVYMSLFILAYIIFETRLQYQRFTSSDGTSFEMQNR